MKKFVMLLIAVAGMAVNCTKDSPQAVPFEMETPISVVNAGISVSLANATPNWKVDARCFLNGPANQFDDHAVKDPSIVFSGGKYHLFYTGRDKGTGGRWRMGYASATSIPGLKTAARSYMAALNAGSYFCAPQIFNFTIKGRWFLIYQSGSGASFSTSTDINKPELWTPVRSMGFTDGIDFWCISDGTDVYVYYSSQDGSHKIKWRKTTVANFPYNWSTPQIAISDTFEAPHVYKNKADGKFYMMVEDMKDNRYMELWTATTLAGPWTQVAEKWASYHNLAYNADHWTDQVSHGEIIRADSNERLEINDIDRCDLLIQGVVNGNYGDYGNIPYELGLMRNY